MPDPCHSGERGGGKGCCSALHLIAIALHHLLTYHLTPQDNTLLAKFKLYTSVYRSPTCENTYKTNFLGIEQNETALISWLQTEGCDMLPDSLLTTASVLFGWVNTHDIMALLDLQQEEDMSYTGFRSQGACLMEDRMLRAQMEISLFSNAIVNLCEYLETRNYPIGAKKTSTVNTIAYAGASPELSPVKFDCFEPSKTLRRLIPKQLEHFFPEGIRSSYWEAKPLYINNNDSFKTKEQKTPEVLRSDIHILGLKKQCMQSKVDMLSEAILRISEFSDDVTSSGSAVTYVSLSIDDYVKDRFDDWYSTSVGRFKASKSCTLSWNINPNYGTLNVVCDILETWFLSHRFADSIRRYWDGTGLTNMLGTTHESAIWIEPLEDQDEHKGMRAMLTYIAHTKRLEQTFRDVTPPEEKEKE
ncbi:hypothetical protein EDB19DRAFT_1825517 [Suillus lakei]|nr:hypothetical protein EDB19DRAFT_1825517 [Suillus lakei]